MKRQIKSTSSGQCINSLCTFFCELSCSEAVGFVWGPQAQKRNNMLHSVKLWLGNNEAALRKKKNQQTLWAEQVEGGDAAVLGDVSLQHWGELWASEQQRILMVFFVLCHQIERYCACLLFFASEKDPHNYCLTIYHKWSNKQDRKKSIKQSVHTHTVLTRWTVDVSVH